MKRNLLSKIMLTAFAAAAVALAGTAGQQAHALARDCSVNSIINCGALDPNEFVTKAGANNPSDLHGIYSSFGLAPQQYAQFATSAKMGTAYKDGRIVVDGRIVADNAWSIGRTGGHSYNRAMTIDGRTYYASNNQDVFRSDSIPVMVLFDSKGVMQFAVLTACGNPITGTKVVPKYSCDLLNKTAVAGKADTYNFTTKASASLGATVQSVTYDFGDGSKVTVSDLNQAVQHGYAKPGNYTATVTVNVTLPGGQHATVTSATCATPIVVKPTQTESQPPAVCQYDHNLPANSPDCAKCDYNAQLLKNSPQCQPPVTQPAAQKPTALPDTGPAGVAGLFAGVSSLGTLGYRWNLKRKLRG